MVRLVWLGTPDICKEKSQAKLRELKMETHCWNKTESASSVTSCGKFVHSNRADGWIAGSRGGYKYIVDIPAV